MAQDYFFPHRPLFLDRLFSIFIADVRDPPQFICYELRAVYIRVGTCAKLTPSAAFKLKTTFYFGLRFAIHVIAMILLKNSFTQRRRHLFQLVSQRYQGEPVDAE